MKVNPRGLVFTVTAGLVLVTREVLIGFESCQNAGVPMARRNAKLPSSRMPSTMS